MPRNRKQPKDGKQSQSGQSCKPQAQQPKDGKQSQSGQSCKAQAQQPKVGKQSGQCCKAQAQQPKVGKQSGQCCKDGKQNQPGQSCKANPSSASRRRAGKNEDVDTLLDVLVKDLVISVTSDKEGNVREKLLTEYLREHTETWYPGICEHTHRVPPIHINKGKEEEKPTNQEYKELSKRQNTDGRGDRAHIVLLDMLEHLSRKFLEKTELGACFIISSYEYDNFLSKLKKKLTSVQSKETEEEIHLPTGTNKMRGEIDILVIRRETIIFVQIKAVGDNFEDYAHTPEKKAAAINKALTRACEQLEGDKKVFKYVLEDIDLREFTIHQVIALPNLPSSCMQEILTVCSTEPKGEEAKPSACSNLMCEWENCKKKKIQFLYADNMPPNKSKSDEHFEVFKNWWMNNVLNKTKFQSCVQDKAEDVGTCESPTGATKLSITDKVKIIVGRYVGIMSTVQVGNSGSSSMRIEVRRPSHGVNYTAQKFSEIILTKEQVEYLNNDAKLGYLCGPPGSGKTVLLSLRAKRWLCAEEDNVVIVINMYRGGEGRAIGKQLFNSIVFHENENKKKHFEEHVIEIPVNVDKFDKDAFIEKVKQKWPQFQTNQALLLVDETYVTSYWQQIFDMLKDYFNDSSIWCAGLYGSTPEHFEDMKLTKVIRCPPKIQALLKAVDWHQDRIKTYITDSTKESLITDGPDILAVRHQHHRNSDTTSPYMCEQCIKKILHIFKHLDIKKPGENQEAEDLQQWPLKTSDVLFLVNMPKTDYRPDKKNYLDTTKSKYLKYMKTMEDSLLVKMLSQQGYKVVVHNELSCNQLISNTGQEVINLTWVYTYQGMENKVIVYLPGDPGMTDELRKDPQYTNWDLNIPCPGLKLDEEQLVSEAASCTMKTVENSLKKEVPVDSGCDTVSSQSPSIAVSDAEEETTDKLVFKNEDLNRYTRWDKSNIFITASRCTSQLLLVVP